VKEVLIKTTATILCALLGALASFFIFMWMDSSTGEGGMAAGLMWALYALPSGVVVGAILGMMSASAYCTANKLNYVPDLWYDDETTGGETGGTAYIVASDIKSADLPEEKKDE
jgi:hypothetical protein